MSLLWKIGGGLVLAAALALLVWAYGRSQYQGGKTDGQLTERVLWQDKVAEAAEARLAGFQLGIARQREAETIYQRTITERLVPVTRTIIERSTAYAATPDGQLLCLPADRVRGLEETRSALFPAAAPATPGGDTRAVPADPSPDRP